MDYAPQIYAEYPVPVFLSRIPGIATPANTGVVEEQVHTTQIFHGFIPDLAHFIFDRNVGDDRQHLVIRSGLQFCSCLLEHRFFDVGHHHVHTFSDAFFRESLTNTACRPRDHSDLASKILHKVPPQKRVEYSWRRRISLTARKSQQTSSALKLLKLDHFTLF